MIITEQFGDRERRYSNLYVKIRQVETGVIYDDAADVIPCPYTYEETDIPIDNEPLEAQEALDAIFGGNDGSV